MPLEYVFGGNGPDIFVKKIGCWYIVSDPKKFDFVKTNSWDHVLQKAASLGYRLASAHPYAEKRDANTSIQERRAV